MDHTPPTPYEFVLMLPAPDNAVYRGRLLGATQLAQIIAAAMGIRSGNLESAALGKDLRVWFAADLHSSQYTPNPLADTTIAALGHSLAAHWRGPVAIASADGGPLPEQALDIVARLTPPDAGLTHDHRTTAHAGAQKLLAQHAPELAGLLKYLDSNIVNGREVRRYEHPGTHRYLYLDTGGQAWRIAVSDSGETLATHMDLDEAKEFVQERDR